MIAGNQGYGQQAGHGQQPEFAWIREWKGPTKLFIGEQRRQDIARDRSLRILVYPWGFTWINGDDELSARWDEVADIVHDVTRHTHQGLVGLKQRAHAGVRRRRHLDVPALPG